MKINPLLRRLPPPRQELDSVDNLLVGPGRFAQGGLFQSEVAAPTYQSLDELLVAGNQNFANLDNLDFAAFRNDRELGQKVLQECQSELRRLAPQLQGEDYQKELRRLLNGRYVQGHGVKVQAHLDGGELAQIRRYLQREASPMNVADAVRAINSSLEAGEQDPQALLLAAERHLYRERGVAGPAFERHAALGLKGLSELRNFADDWAVSESGKFLHLAQGDDLNGRQESIGREVLASQGYQFVDQLDAKTTLSLLRDRNPEGPPTNLRQSEVISAAVGEGVSNYHTLNRLANVAILKDLGVSARLLKTLDLSDEILSATYPNCDPEVSRADQVRVLRDLLRTLPEAPRQEAIQFLREGGVDLVSAESQLSRLAGDAIKSLSGLSTNYGEMSAMRRMSLWAGLSKLPEELRQSAFHARTPVALDTLSQAIEERFSVKVHRQAGQAPHGDDKSAPYVKDWTVDGLVHLYNALESMSVDGKLPPGIAGTTTLIYMEGAAATPSMQVGPTREVVERTFDRPGAYAHPGGQSGYFGMCGQNDKGHDYVVLFDDALYGANGDSPVGVPLAESTLIHELGHAVQLGGTPDAPAAERARQTQEKVAEWSSLSRWREPGQWLADGKMGEAEYYYDPTVQVEARQEVATTYGASDPVEDFAEYVPYFFKDPATAIGLSTEKFVYTNDLVGGFYSSEEMETLLGSAGDLERAKQSVRAKVAAAPSQAGLV